MGQFFLFPLHGVGVFLLAIWLLHGCALGGTGISTGCASATPVGLALAPDLPWEDYPSPGTLGLPVEGFLTPLSLLIPAFALDHSPRRFTPPLHTEVDAPLPRLFKTDVRSFGSVLKPRYIIRAGPLDQ